MLDTLGTDQFLCQFLDLFCLALKDYYFKTTVCITVYMQGGNYLFVMGMLVLGQLV